MSSSSSNSNRRVKMEKEREKQVQDRLQVLICEMLKDEDNKYCVDCDSKGPRWASWNLGLFLCIRCAGIHRNLGVHISKVKSVNLDSWTPVQVASMQIMGNSRARAVYEANLPDGYLRPQNNQALEQFIRTKYERKKYIAKEYVPQKPPEFPEGWYELIEAEKQKKDIRKIVLPSHNASTKSAIPAPSAKPKSPTSSANNNLPTALPSSKSSSSSPSKDNKPGQTPATTKPKSSDDLFGLMVDGGGGDTLIGISGPTVTNSASNDFAAFVSATSASSSTSATTANTNNAEEKDFFNQTTASAAEDKAKSTKDSIMALFGAPPAVAVTALSQPPQQNGFGQTQQQMFGSNFQMSQPQNTGSAVPPTNQFGVNPQSNPFLNTAAAAATPSVASTTAASGGLDLFAAASGGNQSNFAQMQNQFGDLNFAAAFGAPPAAAAATTAAPMMPAALSQPPQQTSSSAGNDLFGLF